MSVKDFVQKNKDLSLYKAEVFSFYQKVVKQALRHTTRSAMDDLHSIARPNEDKIFTDWRKDNRRHVTVDYINQFTRMLQRILSQTLTVNYEYENLDKFLFNKLIPLSIQDANARVVEWPYMPENSLLPPASAVFAENQPLSTESIIVYSEITVVNTNDLLIYYKDHVRINKTDYPRYIGIDRAAYYILEPRLNEKKILYHEPVLWYVHNLGVLPVAELPGIEVNTKVNDQFTNYKESICWPAFEWFDEGIIRLSSEQVVSIKHANAKLVINADIPCPTCDGKGVFGHTTDKEGKDVPKVCSTCNGSRNLNNLSDFSNIKIKSSGAQPGDKGTSNPLYYLQPPLGIKELQDSFMLFFDMGQKALCNDLLEKTGIESGVAKEMRLEPKQDLMRSYGQQICYLIEDLVNNRALLRGGKTVVQVTPPMYYETKSPELLKLQVTEALQGERFMKYMDYVRSKFKDDEFQIKVHKYAVLYAPLILYKSDEFDGAFNAGVYDERDAIRRDYAFYCMEEIFRKEKNLNDLKTIKEKADQILIDQGIMSEKEPLSVEDRAAILDASVEIP